MNGVVLQRIVHSLLWWPIHCLGCPCYLPKLLIFILKSVVAAHVLTIPVKICCFFWSSARALMARVICLSPSLKSAIPMQLSSSSSLPFVEGKTKPVDSISATLIHQQTAAGGMCLLKLAIQNLAYHLLPKDLFCSSSKPAAVNIPEASVSPMQELCSLAVMLINYYSMPLASLSPQHMCT